MVVLSRPVLLDQISLAKTFKPTKIVTPIPEIDLSLADAKTLIIKSCEEFGFFKLVNHGVPLDLITRLENQAVEFFKLSQLEKDKTGPPDPLGYGSKRIGANGDIGWIEYLLLNTNPQLNSLKTQQLFLENPESFRIAVEEYTSAAKRLACEVLELVADGLGITPRNALSKLLMDEKSDSYLRLNHYPPCPQVEALSDRDLIGFGEHTDPQIISILRSNTTSGLQICLKDGSWVPVPPDQTSFFVIVGDSLQVMSNGRLRSVKHRVFADTSRSRVSMIYFGGPPLTQKIGPLPSLTQSGEESLYNEFTWSEFKKSVYKSRLADHRLRLFEKTTTTTTIPPPSSLFDDQSL